MKRPNSSRNPDSRFKKAKIRKARPVLITEDSNSRIPIAAEANCADALRQALGLLLSEQSEQDGLGLMCCGEDKEGFCEQWLQLIHGGAKHFMLLKAPHMEEYPGEIMNHRFLSRLLQRALPALELDALAKRINAREFKTSPDLSGRLQSYLEGILLYGRIKKFSHGTKADLSNQFLAPARLLIAAGVATEEQKHHWQVIWEQFERTVLDALGPVHGSLGEELRVACRPICNWFAESKSNSPTEYDLECLMLLLTRIRALADDRRSDPRSNLVVSGQVTPIEARGGSYRILVVDDHAAEWRPVFQTLATEMEKAGVALHIDFSLDGEILATGGAVKGQVCYAAYDLIILDLFLGHKDGRDILKVLRRDYSQLPVLLWTTSRSEELTAKATLANGILLKKTVSWENMIEAVSFWVQKGKALRTTSLPNAFFNHTIQNLGNRELAVQFHEWCLKQLDSFHALDNEYFRFFTDHGGRHIVKLLELMEQSLQPFLGEEGDNMLLPKEKDDRELEILSLYLAVTCHELGMFPMRIGGEDGLVEDFSKLGRAYLNDVRSLHAARGMVLLQDATAVEGGTGQYWNDSHGRQLGTKLHENQALATRLAILVGYHARLFKSLTPAGFLVWDAPGNPRGERRIGAKNDLAGKLEKLAAPSPVLTRTDDVFAKAFTAAADLIRGTSGENRLRCQCALFRFVDALDITSSRNPAEFLVGSGKLPSKQYGENLKRELCSFARIQDGAVCVVMRAKAPSLDVVLKILDRVRTGKLLQGSERRKAIKACRLLKWTNLKTHVIERPWDPGELNKWSPEAIEGESAVCLQKPLDRWLEEVWKVLTHAGGNSDFIRHLKEDIEILDKNAQEPRLLFSGAEIIGSITALSVAAELLDEYQAIVQAGLHEKIVLPTRVANDGKGGFQWGSSWTPKQLPFALNTLRSVFPEDEKNSEK